MVVYIINKQPESGKFFGQVGTYGLALADLHATYGKLAATHATNGKPAATHATTN